ncbi:MAG: glycosyltransferase family 39 protein [Vicinamibacterales bacterium]
MPDLGSLTITPPRVDVEAAARPARARARVSRRFRVDLAAIAALAVVPRLLVIVSTPENAPFSDMVDYHLRAQTLLSGEALPDSFRGPGYPAWLALFYALPIADMLAARVGNLILGAATAVATTILAREVVGRRAAMAAGAIVALYPAGVVSTAYIMPEGLYGLFTVLALIAASRSSISAAATAGVLTGLSALTRALGVGLLPVMGAGLAVQAWRDGRWRHAVMRAAVIGVACLAVLAPWLWQTSRISGGPMLDSASAYNVLLGANPRARERLDIADGNWVRATYLAGPMNEAEQNRRALEASWEWIRSHPGRWLWLAVRKMTSLWGLEGREHAWAYSHGYLGAHATGTVRAWGLALLFCLPPLAVAALIGLLRPGLLSTMTGVHILMILATVTLMHGISFSETRYHLPLIPFAAVLAVRSVPGPAITRGRWLIVGLIAAALAVGWWQQLPELLERYAMLSTAYGWRLELPF